jgi:hypothetical protein
LLLLLSVWERVRSYGVTEERYLGIIAGAWILAWAIIFLVRQSAGIRWVPASLAIICFLAAFGPISAGTVSKASQFRRLTKMLEEDGLLANGKIQLPKTKITLPTADYEALRSTLQYLASMHGAQVMRALFSGLYSDADWNYLLQWPASAGYNLIGKLNLTGEPSPPGSTYYSFDQDKGLTADDFNRTSYLSLPYNGTWTATRKQMGSLFVGIDNGVLKAADTADALPQPIPLDPLFKSLSTSVENMVPAQRLTADWQHNGHSYRIIFINLFLTRNPDDSARINSCTFLLLEK